MACTHDLTKPGALYTRPGGKGYCRECKREQSLKHYHTIGMAKRRAASRRKGGKPVNEQRGMPFVDDETRRSILTENYLSLRATRSMAMPWERDAIDARLREMEAELAR